MNSLLVTGILGRLLSAYACTMLIPLAVSLYMDDGAAVGLGLSVLITFLSGLIAIRCGTTHGSLGIREGYAVVLGSWLLASMYGALPFQLTGSLPSYIDALFETVSGLTTTGATTISDLEVISDGVMLWRSLTHWLGGMGIVVLFIAVLPSLGVSAFHLFKAEVPGPMAEKIVPRIRDTAVALWSVYVLFTTVEVILLVLAGMSWFDAVNHSFATLATGGFSTRNASIKHYDNLTIELIITFFMILAGGSFGLYFQVPRHGLMKVVKDTEFRIYLAIIAASVGLITLNLTLTGTASAGKSLRDALFQVASIITTTGFATVDFDQWPSFSKLVLLLLMFSGGCAGSTAGGIKVARIIILCKAGWAELKKLVHSRVVTSIHLDDKPVEAVVINAVMQFFFLYMLIYAIAVLAISATGLEPFDAISVVASALGNVGPGFGVVGPATTYAALSPVAKIVLSACMLLGRLELFTMLVFVRPEFWRWQRNW